MRSLAPKVLAIGVLTAASFACGYPNFVYRDDPHSTSAGVTSVGGGSPTATSTTSVMSTGGAMPATTVTTGGGSPATTSSVGGGGATGGVQVPCTEQGTLCAPGQICCAAIYQPGKPKCDECIDPDDECGADESETFCSMPSVYARYRCNTSSQCTNGDVCCADLDDSGDIATATSCRASCTSQQSKACTNDDECGSDVCFATVYPGYSYCL